MKSIAEKAKQLGCDKETIRKKCLKCELPCKKVDSTWIVFDEGEQVTAIKKDNGEFYIHTNKN